MRLNASLLVLLSAFANSGPAAAPADPPAPPEDVLKTLKVPDGFTVERVAASPLVERPMLAAFDDVGRLYVCDSAGVNLKGPELARQLPHSIKRLEDTDGDG